MTGRRSQVDDKKFEELMKQVSKNTMGFPTSKLGGGRQPPQIFEK